MMLLGNGSDDTDYAFEKTESRVGNHTVRQPREITRQHLQEMERAAGV